MGDVTDREAPCPAPVPAPRGSTRWLGRVALLLGAGAALLLAGSGTASAEETASGPVEVGLVVGSPQGGTVEVPLEVAVEVPVPAAVPVPVPAHVHVPVDVPRTVAAVPAQARDLAVEATRRVAAPVAAVVGSPAAQAVLGTGTAVVESVVEQVRTVPDAVRPATAVESPVPTPSAPRAAGVVAAADPAQSDAAAVAPVALPGPVAAVGSVPPPALAPNAAVASADARGGTPEQPRPVLPTPALPSAGDRAGSSSGGQDGGAAVLTESPCGTPGAGDASRSPARRDAVRCVVLDPSFSPD